MDCPSSARVPDAPKNPKQAKKFFEFFKRGTRREVLLLGELIEQPVHFVRSKGYKLLCTARVGVCRLCEESATTDNIAEQQIEYYAPSFVREWSRTDFAQRVSVFTAASGEKLLALFPSGSARGRRVDVQSLANGTSVKYVIKQLEGLPRGFPLSVPPSFDVLPFIRARYGLPQEPNRPLVILPAFRSEAESAATPAGRPKPLDLSVSDIRSAEELSKLKELLAERNRWGGGEAPTPATPTPTPSPAPAEIVEQKPSEAEVIKLASDTANYGPLEKVAGPPAAPEVKEAPKRLPTPRVSLTKAAMKVADNAERARLESAAKRGEAPPSNRETTIGDMLPKIFQPEANGGAA